MTLNKKKMVREIGRRTRIRNRDVQAVIEALIDVWTEELISGGRIELERLATLYVAHRQNARYESATVGNRNLVFRASRRLLNAITSKTQS